MRLVILNPVADLEVQYTNDLKVVEVARFRCAGDIHNRPAYKRIDRDDGVDQRLFWLESQRGRALPREGRWLLVNLKDDGTDGGIDNIIARSHNDGGESWASLWPWEAQKGGWERATCKTYGLVPGDAEFLLDKSLWVRMLSPSISFVGTEGAPVDVSGTFAADGMTNGRVHYIQELKQALSDAGSLSIWFAEDRGQWVVTGTDKLGDSTQVLGRISSRAWWPWECHLTSNSSPTLMGAAMLAAMPEWCHGAAMLSSLRATWEMSDAQGKFQAVPDMAVDLNHAKDLKVTAGEGAQHPFLGRYRHAGLLSSRPYFLQDRKDKKSPVRFAVWYAEDAENWVITNDYRILDGDTVDARADDSAWLPWEVVSCWEVSDGQGDFIDDILLKVEVSQREHSRSNKKSKPNKTRVKPSPSESSVTSGSDRG